MHTFYILQKHRCFQELEKGYIENKLDLKKIKMTFKFHQPYKVLNVY